MRQKRPFRSQEVVLAHRRAPWLWSGHGPVLKRRQIQEPPASTAARKWRGNIVSRTYFRFLIATRFRSLFCGEFPKTLESQCNSTWWDMQLLLFLMSFIFPFFVVSRETTVKRQKKVFSLRTPLWCEYEVVRSLNRFYFEVAPTSEVKWKPGLFSRERSCACTFSRQQHWQTRQSPQPSLHSTLPTWVHHVT